MNHQIGPDYLPKLLNVSNANKMLPTQLYLTSKTLLNRKHPKQKYHMYHHVQAYHMENCSQIFFLSGINFDPRASNAPFTKIKVVVCKPKAIA